MDKVILGTLRSHLSEISLWKEMSSKYEAGEDISSYLTLENALQDAKTRTKSVELAKEEEEEEKEKKKTKKKKNAQKSQSNDEAM